MNVFKSSSVWDWARISAATVAVGTLLVVQVANADRPQNGQSERPNPTELVVATGSDSLPPTDEPSYNAIRYEQSHRPDQSSAGATAAALAAASFYAIPPYRSYDSRFDPNGALTAGYYYDIKVSTEGLQRQVIPDNAVAVTYNLTVTGTTGDAGGYLALYPAGTAWPGNSSINWWTSGLSLANGGVVSLGTCPVFGAGCVEVDISPAPGTATHFIIDVTGYYAP